MVFKPSTGAKKNMRAISEMSVCVTFKPLNNGFVIRLKFPHYGFYIKLGH